MVQERFQVGSGRLTVFNSWTGEQCGAYKRVAGCGLDFGASTGSGLESAAAVRE